MKKVLYLIHAILLSIIVIWPARCGSLPKLGLDDIKKDIVGKSTGVGQNPWIFEADEPREISIVESKYEGDKATIIVNMKTETAGPTLMTHVVAGRLKLHYEWIANKWNLMRVENLSFKLRKIKGNDT